MAGVRLAEKDFVLDALEQALHARCGTTLPGLVHHRDRGTQYLSMRYTDRLARARPQPKPHAVPRREEEEDGDELTGVEPPPHAEGHAQTTDHQDVRNIERKRHTPERYEGFGSL